MSPSTEINGIYKMPNKTRQKLYFAVILDLEHQWTPLTTGWLANFRKQTFRVVLRAVNLWMPVASHSEAGTADSKWAKYPKTGPIVRISVSTTPLHPGQPRKGAQCAKYQNSPLSDQTHTSSDKGNVENRTEFRFCKRLQKQWVEYIKHIHE